jgi:penicillin-binding protein 2
MINLKEPTRHPGVEMRVQLTALGLALAFSVLVWKLWQLQVVDQQQYTSAAEENRVWKKRLKSDRGVIYARNGEVLADNRASADIVLTPGEMPKEGREEICNLLAQLLGVNAAELMEKITQKKGEPFEQILVKEDISKAERTRVEEYSHALTGVFTVVRPQRRYHYGETAGQILGFLGQINQRELEAKAGEGYTMGDLYGRDGVERMYEDLLHGQDGYAVVTKFASGRPQLRTDRRGIPRIAPRDTSGNLLGGEERREDPEAGQAVHLSLDMGLQAKCEDLLRGKQGSIVVLNADNGEVLALASLPTYDPSVFVGAGNSAERMRLLKATDPKPMVCGAFKEQYPPGSVFKIMLAAAALEEGVIDEHSTYYCPGKFRINGKGRPWHCHKRAGHGSVNVGDALTLSCDVFFYNVGLKLGVDKIVEWSNKMGLGVRTGIDLPGEITGLVPSREWKKKLFAKREKWYQDWTAGDTVNMSIGQGSMATTPLQNAVLMACIANGGRTVRPYLNVDIEHEIPQPILSPETVRIIHAGMQRCVEDPNRGTGRKSAIPGFQILGKTGSAQIMSLEHHEEFEKEEDIPYEFRDHAWFVAAVLDRSPRIALCVLVEHGHHGSTAAAPLAKDVIEYFYGPGNGAQPVTLAQGATP